jgi:hypothetical protein
MSGPSNRRGRVQPERWAGCLAPLCGASVERKTPGNRRRRTSGGSYASGVRLRRLTLSNGSKRPHQLLEALHAQGSHGALESTPVPSIGRSACPGHGDTLGVPTATWRDPWPGGVRLASGRQRTPSCWRPSPGRVTEIGPTQIAQPTTSNGPQLGGGELPAETPGVSRAARARRSWARPWQRRWPGSRRAAVRGRPRRASVRRRRRPFARRRSASG